MEIIAHRAGSLENKENSWNAFINSKNNKCNGIEFDIHFTNDNIPVINHDINLNKMHNNDKIIKFEYYKNIKNYVIKLEDILEFIKGEKTLFIEIKDNPNNNQLTIFIDMMLLYLDKYSFYNKQIFYIMSFNYNIVKRLSNFFDIKYISFITACIYDIDILNELLKNNYFSNICLSIDALSKQMITILKIKKINIYVYTINYINLFNYINNNFEKNSIKGIITDKPNLFL